MKPTRFKTFLYVTVIGFIAGFHLHVMAAENIDPDNDDFQYAYGENVGWLNAEPSDDGGPGVEVADTILSGYIWAENIGWISLSCENTDSCSKVGYGVTNDGLGHLSGYAWSENAGWISFSCENWDSCDSVDYGVTIDAATGEFSGNAWGENIGWVTFRSMGLVPYGITTAWVTSIDPPVIDNIAFNPCISELCSSVIRVTAHDPSGGSLSYSWETPNGGSIVGDGPEVAFDPPSPSPYPACDPFHVIAVATSDTSGLSAQATVSIIVKLAGDANGDGFVNILDKVMVRNAFGSSGENPADVNCDNVVNILDKVIIRNQFGQSGCPCP